MEIGLKIAGRLDQISERVDNIIFSISTKVRIGIHNVSLGAGGEACECACIC